MPLKDTFSTAQKIAFSFSAIANMAPFRFKNYWKERQVFITKECSISPYFKHDETLSALMAVMEVSDFLLPPYAACLIMEVYEDNGLYSAEVIVLDRLLVRNVQPILKF